MNREGPMRLTVLAAAECASQSGMTQLVERVERHGLAERWSDPGDGRASLVIFGEAGPQMWDARAHVRRQRVADMLPAASRADQVTL
jgi:DNA-binding MarR family transcriptional regulator